MYGTDHVKKYKWHLLLLVMLLAVDGILIGISFRSYQDEIIAFGGILTEQGADQLSFEEAEAILSAYGYGRILGSDPQRRLALCAVITVVSSVILYGIVIWITEKVRENALRQNAERLNIIEQTADQLREGKFQPVYDRFASDTDDEKERLQLQRISTALDGLNGAVLLAREKAAEDRRNTKEAVSDISHQLKTPLMAIRSTFEILCGEDLTEAERKEFQDAMALQISGLEELMESLVNVSRLESGMIELDLKRGRLFDTILDAVNRIWQKANAKKITVELEADGKEGEAAELLQDKKWLTEAFINILDNAIKYSGENTVITIKIVPMSALMRIEFQDQGIGIPPGEKHKVFQRFYRGSEKQVRKESGSGLGLYLARRIISEHGGTIMVKDHHENGRRRGSIFVVQIPLLS